MRKCLKSSVLQISLPPQLDRFCVQEKKKKFKEEGLVNENRQHKDIIVSKMKKKTGSKDGFRHRLE